MREEDKLKMEVGEVTDGMRRVSFVIDELDCACVIKAIDAALSVNLENSIKSKITRIATNMRLSTTEETDELYKLFVKYKNKD